MNKKYMDALAECTLFQGMGPEDLATIFACLNPKVNSYEKNELIKVAGTPFSGVGIVISGEVVIMKESAAGDRVIMGLAGPGEMFGEMVAFAQGGVWPATVVAQSPCKVVFLPPEKIIGSCEKACENHKLLIQNMLRIISRKALGLNRKVEYLAIKSLRGKIAAFLLEQYKIAGKTTFLIPLKRDELADFLNVSRPSLSREMGRMRDEGVIEFHRASVKIKDVEGLKKMAE